MKWVIAILWAVIIVVFIILGTAAYQLSKRLKSANVRIAVVFARMSLVIVNIAFWIGSFFGDTVGKMNFGENFDYSALEAAYNSFLPTWIDGSVLLSSDFFAVLWAIAIVLTGVWAVRANSAFTLNTVATFAGIHFYTQWFERFGAEAWSLFVAGGIAVLIGFGLSFVNNEKSKNVAAVKAAVSNTAPVKAPAAKKSVAKRKPATKKRAKK